MEVACVEEVVDPLPAIVIRLRFRVRQPRAHGMKSFFTLLTSAWATSLS